MTKASLAGSLTPSECPPAIERTTRLSEKARRRIKTGQYEVELHDPLEAERLSIALSEVAELEECAVRVIRVLLLP